MAKILPYILFLFSLWSLCSSCHHQYYAPSDAMLLGLDEKGDIRASAKIGTNLGEGNQKFNYSVVAGYSPLKNVGIMANFFHLINKRNFTSPPLDKSFSSEIALGFYKTLRQSKSLYFIYPDYSTVKQVPRRKLIGDIYAGYGYGQAHNHYGKSGLSKLNFNKYFLQSALHIKYKKSITNSLGLKFVRLDYQKSLLLGQIPEGEMTIIRNISRLNPFSFWELLAKMEIGSGDVKFFWQITFTSKFTSNIQLEYVPMVFSTGISFDFKKTKL